MNGSMYVLCLCVRHGPDVPARREVWLHGFRPGLTRGVVTLILVCEPGIRRTP